jgi:RNA polymerase sigma-70 factor (ECF subfamily)
MPDGVRTVCPPRASFYIELRTSTQEAQWVLRAQSDDREALERLLDSVQPSLHRYLCGLVGRDDADDVLQDVLLLIYRKLVWLEHPELFRAWAFRIASRAAFRWLKRRKGWREDAVPEDVLEAHAALREPPAKDLLRTLHDVAGISPASRAVLILHFQEELPLMEIAAILEIPVGTVKSRLAYGLASLRRQLCVRRRA